MVYRINPNQQPLWRTPFELQLGAGKNPVVLKQLSVGQERLIAALYKGIANQQLPLISKQLGLAKGEAEQVLQQVDGLLLTEAPKQKKKLELNSDFVSSAFAEIIRASLLHSVDGEAVLLGRASRSVHIESLGRAGLAISLGLAAAGIGHLISHDDEKVDRANLGPTGYPTQLLGHPRIEALRSLLAASPNSALVSTGKKLREKNLEKVDCAVLVAQQAIDPRRYAAWMNRDVPHLVVSFDSECVSVSPMIVPGQTACLFCFENMRTDQNPKWPVLASQLVTSQKRFDDAASQLFAAGLAVQKILSRMDQVAGFKLAPENLIGYRLELASGEVTEYTWSQHPACGCKYDAQAAAS